MRYLFLILSLGAGISSCFAQKEASTTYEPSVEAKNAATDSLFFEAIKAKMHNDDRAARSLLEQFAIERPEVSAADYELARFSHGDRAFDNAESYITQAISLDAGNKWYREEYASILADKGDVVGAAKVEAKLCDDFPGDRSYPEMTADYYERAKKYDEAITYLDRGLTQVGADEDLLLKKAQVYVEADNVDKAAEVLEQMIARDQHNPKNYKLLGELYDNNKMYDKAAAVYDRGLKAIPDDPFIELGLVMHYQKTGDSAAYTRYVRKIALNESLDLETQIEFLKTYIQSLPNDSGQLKQLAMPIVEQLVNRHPDNPEVMEMDGIMLEVINQPEKAVAALRRSLDIKPASYKTWVNLLELCADKQYADSLIKFSQQAIKYFPTQGGLHYYNGVGHYYKKEYDAAAKAINRAIDMSTDNNKTVMAGMYSFLGDIYHANRQDQLSDEAYRKALELEPDNATTLNNYAYYLSERGMRLDEAEKMSKKSLELRQDEATFLDTYGWIMYRKGDYERAKENIEKAIQMAGDRADGTLYDHLGNVYYKLNDKDKAIENWKRSKQKGTDDANIDKKIEEGKLYE